MFAAAIEKRRRARQNVSAFSTLIENPSVGEFLMPQSGRLRFVSREGCEEGTTAATLVGCFPIYSDVGGVIVRGAVANRTIKTPLLAAAGGVVLDGLVARASVILSSGFDCYLDIGLGRWALIATVDGGGGGAGSFSSEAFSSDAFSSESFN